MHALVGAAQPAPPARRAGAAHAEALDRILGRQARKADARAGAVVVVVVAAAAAAAVVKRDVQVQHDVVAQQPVGRADVCGRVLLIWCLCVCV